MLSRILCNPCRDLSFTASIVLQTTQRLCARKMQEGGVHRDDRIGDIPNVSGSKDQNQPQPCIEDITSTIDEDRPTVSYFEDVYKDLH